MLSALRYDGQPAESGWPYLATLPADLAHWNPPPGVAPIFRRAGEARACTIDTIIAQLDRGVAVLVLMYLSPSFYHPGRNGIIDEAPGESPDLSLCHAMAAVGHGVASASRAVLMRNSWGSGWGDNGYGWLTEKFLRPRIDELAILKEDLSVSRHPASA